MSEGTPLPRSIVEYYYKSEELSEPMVSEEHITAFGWATPQDLDEVMALSLRINDFLSGLFLGIGMRLMDLSVEFGRLWEDDQVRIVLADEICPVPAGCGTSAPTSASTASASAATSASSRTPTRRSRAGSAFFPRAVQPI